MSADDVERAARAMWDALNPGKEAAKAWLGWRGINLKRAQAALLAYHRSRTPSPEEVEAVARAIHVTDKDMAPWESMSDRYQNMTRLEARAALAASDAWRAQQIERITTA